jgi:hypothetical protein
MLRAASKLLQWQSARAGGWAAGSLAAAATIAPPGGGGSASWSAPAEGDGNGPVTDFSRRAAHLKRRLRGRAQYAFAREEAQRFLDAEVPKTDLNTWMDSGSNAIALSQLLQFFEIQPEASVASLLLSKLIRQAEDGTLDIGTRVYAARSLLQLRPEENYERVFQVIAKVLQHILSAPPPPQDTSPLQRSNDGARHATPNGTSEACDVLAQCAKILQRCGRRVPPTLSDELARAIMMELQRIDQGNLWSHQQSLLRFYSWMVRAERPEANQVLYALVEYTGDFATMEFATLALACVRHNQLVPLPLELVERLTRTAVRYSANINGMAAANILGSLARILHTVTPNVNGVTTTDLYRVRDYYSALLEDNSERVIHFMDPSDRLYWESAEDISNIAFAFELGGHVRYRRVFEAYGAYVQHNGQAFEPPQLALATGILRRAQLLTPQLAAKLSERIEVVLGELRLAELSHICATFAVLPTSKPSWWDEAKAVALRLYEPDAGGLVRLNLAIAFPDEPNLVGTVDYTQITSKQLVDVLPITLGSAQFEGPVVSALCSRLAAPDERFTSDDLRLVLSCGRPALLQAAQAHLNRAFAEPQWNTDTLFSLPLVCDPHHPERNLQTVSAAKALAAAKAASVAPLQFVSLADLLLTTFGDSDAAIRQFVLAGGDDLIKPERVIIKAVVRYLAAVRRYPSLTLSTEWLRRFTDHVEGMRAFSKSDLEDILISFRSLFEDVAKTPALQMLLSLVVEKWSASWTDADEQTARITVLLVYLQCGMTLPLITAKDALLTRVSANDATYSTQVRRALAMMPLPKSAPPEERRGRFVLKHLDRTHAAHHSAASAALDLNMTDPFEVPFDDAAPFTAAKAASPPPPAPQQQQQKQQDVMSSAAPTPLTTAPVVGPLPDPYRPPPPPSSPEEAAPPATEGPPPTEKHMSYYAKFFGSSVGQILTGRGTHDDANRQAAQETPATATTAAAAADTPQPRRTRLHPTAASAGAASTTATAVPSSSSSPSPASATPPPQTPALAAIPVTSFTTAWGSSPPPPPPQSSSTAPGTMSPPLSGWAFAANPLPSASAPAASAWEQQHTTTFSSLFGSAPPPPSVQAAAGAAAAGATPAAPVHAVRPPAPRPAGMGGNNVFFDPSKPSSSASSSSPSAALRSRPVMSRKAVITRQGAVSHNNGGSTATTATAEQDEVRRIYSDPSRATEVHAHASSIGGPEIVLDATAVPNAAAGMGNRSSSVPVTSHNNSMSSNNNGMAHFMQKTGVTKISGYNMDGEAASSAAEEGSVAAASGLTENIRPALDWMDAARRVARVTRHPRTKAKSRMHNSLSAWLNTPSARLDATSAEAEDAAASVAEAAEEEEEAPSETTAKSAARQTTVAAALHRKRTKKDKAAAAAAAMAAEAAEVETPANSKRGGRGKGGKATAAGNAAKAAATAASKKKTAPKGVAGAAAAAKPATTKGLGGGRAKKATPPPAAKPTVKSAKKTVKAAAAAKKPAPAKKKPAGGKGKKK